jgi:hypothetical protein
MATRHQRNTHKTYIEGQTTPVIRCTSSDYPFGVLWPLCCLPFDVRLLLIPLVSCGHYVVCPSMYVFCLSLWCLAVIVLSVLRCTSSDYPFGVLWPLCCLPFDVRLLLIPLVSCGHYVVCPSMYVFCLPLWCLVAIMLSALRCTSSDYPFGVLWSLCCLPFDVRLLKMATRHQRDNQKTYIEGHTTQWPQDTKGVIRRRTSKDRQHNGHETPKR